MQHCITGECNRNQAVHGIILRGMATVTLFAQRNGQLRSAKCYLGQASDGGVLWFVSFSFGL
jgi:hypothetical protein